MRCRHCPLYIPCIEEIAEEPKCYIFGDKWDSQFLYRNKDKVSGCYLETCYIKNYWNELKEKINKEFNNGKINEKN